MKKIIFIVCGVFLFVACASPKVCYTYDGSKVPKGVIHKHKK